MQNSEFLTTAQAADFLGLKKGTLEIWRVYGKGAAFIKMGRAVRYRREDLERWITDQKRTHTA
ncbi:helix-turn-helix transcriptional regulator [Desulfobotulus mexicanus]|uniref:Helix-turn-helix domain-containing protein n=1 Tax=Desulfobotulus mexicanus TaxID=2586642 RepID=A0A5S5MF51_9BACT|nr:helix-turn-helix domain-containing protein [Desulfobotulus mexicanus]